MILLTGLMFASFGQSQNATQQKTADYIAIEDQSGIQVSYVYDNPESPTCFFVKITNQSLSDQTVEYQILNTDADKVATSYAPIKIKAGESFTANDLTLAIPIKKGTKLSNYSTLLTIK